MGRSIRLHPTLDLNPRLVVCSRCGEDLPEIALPGATNFCSVCPECDASFIGRMKVTRCLKCGKHVSLGEWKTRPLGEFEKLAGGLCESCEQELAEHRAIVEAGGIYWKCKGCRRDGVMRDNYFAMVVRASAKIQPPDPVGIEFASCEEHGGKSFGVTVAPKHAANMKVDGTDGL